jgi:hypothetical protein
MKLFGCFLALALLGASQAVAQCKKVIALKHLWVDEIMLNRPWSYVHKAEIAEGFISAHDAYGHILLVGCDPEKPTCKKMQRLSRDEGPYLATFCEEGDDPARVYFRSINDMTGPVLFKGSLVTEADLASVDRLVPRNLLQKDLNH